MFVNPAEDEVGHIPWSRSIYPLSDLERILMPFRTIKTSVVYC